MNTCGSRPWWPRALSRPFLAGLTATTLALPGCQASLSPSVPLFGAYFPSWLICLAGGIIGAVVLRVLFIRIGLDEVLPLRLLVYACLAAAIGLLLALTLYGR
ncbi:YtcA family lipoprotein [Neoroseomonas alba]|uniref:YtcA family lipoprotein n=1 Tax=Roseomonas alba TaxID=2846776 RepID=UPI001CA56FD1